VKEELDVGEHREDKKRRHHNQGFMGELHGCGWPGRAGRSTCAGKVEKTRLVRMNAMEES
jgi:hypothetical protein